MTITSPRRSSRRLRLVLALAAIAGSALFSAATANAGVVTGRRAARTSARNAPSRSEASR